MSIGLPIHRCQVQFFTSYDTNPSYRPHQIITPDALFVFTSSVPCVALGDSVRV
jgi:hypothetical protein